MLVTYHHALACRGVPGSDAQPATKARLRGQMLPVPVEGWEAFALCRGPECPTSMFYLPRGEDQQRTRAVCADCPVREECLWAALRRGEQFGMWGGLSERQRRRVRAPLARAISDGITDRAQLLEIVIRESAPRQRRRRSRPTQERARAGR